MISDLTTTTGRAITRAGQSDMVLAAFDAQPIQPVADVPAYLGNRAPRPTYVGEECLLITLPGKLQREVKALVRACEFVAGLVKSKLKVQPACEQALRIYSVWNWKLKTFRAKYDEWATKQDWIVLVNRAKAPACWRESNAGLPEAFLALCETKFGAFKRGDGKRQALLAIKRQWSTGRNEQGIEQTIAGYETDWKKRNPEVMPDGWSYSNIMRQIAKRARFTKGVRALLHEGESAAREYLPYVLGSRRNLRFLEKITFDDVRMDWLVFNPASGQAEELWMLVARDEATAMVLGFVMHPATIREDGKASHLGARQMKELAAYLLERYPLPPYLVHWIVERGTATLAEGIKAALAELFNNRIKVHYTSMIGDLSPVGYAEKRKGNSRGKASHESHNRLFHTQGSFIPGQTGANWGIRPADLEARVKECRSIFEFQQQLPETKRGDVKFPLLTLQQARAQFAKLCEEQNHRKEHDLEAFEEIVVEEGGQMVQRKEMPVERALRLIRSVERWDRVEPSIVRTFLEHTERKVEVEANGEIKFMLDGRTLYFRNAGVALPPGTKALAYHHSDDPQFLHLTSGDGRVLGTWVQRGRGAFLDNAALEQAMRYTHSAREAAKATAAELAAPARAELDAMRANNAALEQFVVTANVPDAVGNERGSNVGAILTNTAAAQRAAKKAGEQRRRDLSAFDGEISDLAAPAAEVAATRDDFSAEGLL